MADKKSSTLIDVDPGKLNERLSHIRRWCSDNSVSYNAFFGVFDPYFRDRRSAARVRQRMGLERIATELDAIWIEKAERIVAHVKAFAGKKKKSR